MRLGYDCSTQLRGARKISSGNVVKPTGSETSGGAWPAARASARPLSQYARAAEAPVPVSQYSVIEASGTRVYVAGGGVGGGAAAFDPSTGAPLWSLKGDGDFQGVAYLDGQVYFGGHFRVLDDGTRRKRLLAVAANTGALSEWNPKADRGVWALEADAPNTRAYAGGDFTKISGQPREGFAQFSVGPRARERRLKRPRSTAR